MIVLRIFLFIVCISSFLLPFNWLWIWEQGQRQAWKNISDLLLSCFYSWIICAATAGLLVFLAKRAKRQRELLQQKKQELLSRPLTEIVPSNVILKTGERAYSSVIAYLLKEKTLGYSGGSSGVSIRVARGITYRTGRIKGHAVRGMVEVASGELVITDRRVVFAGDKKSFSISLDNLLNITHYSDGIGFNDSKASYTVKISRNNDKDEFIVTLDKVIRQKSSL